MPTLPMFPLGTVLLPQMVLPLHVFEPRYRALVEDVLVGDGEFGVVLITRGHEVGGGDARAEVGTVAQVLRSEALEDGRWLLVAVGTRRFEVRRWLGEEPYPRAETIPRHDEHDDGEILERVRAIQPRLRRILAMRAELGDEAGRAGLKLADDPEVACWQAVSIAPLTPFDAQRLLATDNCAARIALLDELLVGLEDTLTFRLGAG